MEVCPEPKRIILQNSAAFGNDSLDIGQRGETQMIRHMRHGSPPRLMAPQPIRVPERRESHPTPSAGNRMTRHVALDADGSPRAYHPNDTGLDALANAGYPHKGWKSVLVVDPNDHSRPYVQPNGPTKGY